VRRLLLCLAIGTALVAVPTATASPTVRLAIVHAFRGCHVWGTSESQPLGPARTLTVRRGARVEVRVNCPMTFQVVQIAGPGTASPTVWQPGTSHTLVFARRGLYRFRATSTMTSEQMGLQTLGPDNVLTLTVRVR